MDTPKSSNFVEIFFGLFIFKVLKNQLAAVNDSKEWKFTLSCPYSKIKKKISVGPSCMGVLFCQLSLNRQAVSLKAFKMDFKLSTVLPAIKGTETSKSLEHTIWEYWLSTFHDMQSLIWILWRNSIFCKQYMEFWFSVLII
jgi:hypothetical protein